jgi:hypothetical protein
MTDRELLEKIANVFDGIERNTALISDVQACEILCKAGFMKIQTIEDDNGRLIGEEYVRLISKERL